MQTITNYLIANMAVSDIVITFLVVPRHITEILVRPYGAPFFVKAFLFYMIS